VPSLLIRSGPTAGRRIELSHELVVGRRGGDLELEDPRISRRHARFRLVGGALEIEDLGSSNGTWVNGSRITSATRLGSGDVVELGGTAIVVEAETAEAYPAESQEAPEPRQPPPGAPSEEPASHPPAGELPDGVPIRADELRPVTALFADVVGSTAIGERLTPEEVKALIGECVSRMAAAVEQFGGVVDAFMGDGIAAFFGVPVAHEDDAERAARAALHIVHVIGDYARDIEAAWGFPDFNVRVGINGGQVAVGLVGGERLHPVALGDTANVAARIQGVAEAGSIVVGEATATRLEHDFVLEPLGEVAVKGRTEPVSLWRLEGPRRVTGDQPTTPLVGRDAELERLAHARDDLLAGRGRVLLLLGDAGIGKTRLLGELRGSAGPTVTWLQGNCVSYGKEFPFLPIVDALRTWLGLEDEDASLAVRTRLRIKLEPFLGPRLQETLPHLEALLTGGLGRSPAASGDELARDVVQACCVWIESLTESGPVALALDDFQWADPWTCALAEQLLEIVERSSLLLAATLRVAPDSGGWRLRVKVLADHPHRALELPLEPLSGDDAARLLSLLQPEGLSDEARREIIARGEGNPLYIEQLLRVTVESGELGAQDQWAASPNATRLVPAALVNLLLSRLDNLPAEARQLAQVAAVTGRSFSLRMLTAVDPEPDPGQSLNVLVRAGVVRERRRYPQLEYTFTHGLLRDAALLTLTRARRRKLYGRVAAAYEELVADSVEEHLDLLAHYYGRSDDLRKGLDYLERAAERALGLGAGFQAAELLRRARAVAAEAGDAEAGRRISARLEQAVGGTS
jgi:class 3 adenylate cyclase